MAEITALEQVAEGRLCWPDSKPRSAQRIASAFKGREVVRETKEIEWEMDRWRVRHWIMSRNNQRIFSGDPAAALWWNDRRSGDIRVLACDKYTKLADNIHAILLTLNAMRALERWGAYTAEQAAEGARLALPPPAEDRIDWQTILGAKRDWPIEAVEAMWKNKVAHSHPDRGGDPAKMAELNAAMDAARKELARG